MKKILLLFLIFPPVNMYTIMQYDEHFDRYSTTNRKPGIDQGHYNNLMHHLNWLVAVAHEFSSPFCVNKVAKLMMIKYLNDDQTITAQAALEDLQQLWILEEYQEQKGKPWYKRLYSRLSSGLYQLKQASYMMMLKAYTIVPARK